MPTYFNVVTRPYCVDIIRLYLHHLVIVLQYVLSVASITFSVYFHPKIYSFDVNEIYPVFDSDLCVYRCCVRAMYHAFVDGEHPKLTGRAKRGVRIGCLGRSAKLA